MNSMIVAVQQSLACTALLFHQAAVTASWPAALLGSRDAQLQAGSGAHRLTCVPPISCMPGIDSSSKLLEC